MRFDYGHDEEPRLGRHYDLKLLRRLLPQARPHWGKLTIAMTLVVVITLLELSVPRITQKIIDHYITPDIALGSRISPETGPSESDLKILRQADLSGLSRATRVFLAVIAAIFVCSFFQNLLMEITGNHIMHNLRMTLYNHIQSMPLSFFTRTPVARLVTRVANDITNMHDLFTNFSFMVIKDLLLITGIAAALLLMNWKLALLAFVVLPFTALATFGFSKKARGVFRELRVKVAQINAYLPN